MGAAVDELSPSVKLEVALADGSAGVVPFCGRLEPEATAVCPALLALIDIAASFMAEIESDR